MSNGPTKKENKKYSYAKVKARNAFLAEHWFSRFFLIFIVLGGALDKANFRALLILMFLSLILITVMLVDLFLFAASLFSGNRLVAIAVILPCVSAFIMNFPVVYGYRIRHKIDSTNVVTIDFIKALRYSSIGAGVASLATCAS